ncbi:MAG: hypothetical protein AAGA69_12770, partial [Pseudomonadota bacterium]
MTTAPTQETPSRTLWQKLKRSRKIPADSVEAAVAGIEGQGLRQRLLVTVALSLTPVLLFAGLRAYTDSQVALQERREDLLIQSERAIDRVEQSLASAELLLSLYADNIAQDECAEVQQRLTPELHFVINTVFFDSTGIATCSAVGEAGYKIHNARWLTRLREGESKLRTDAYPIAAGEEWIFNILTRNEAVDGSFAGLSGLGISIEQLIDLIPSHQLA